MTDPSSEAAYHALANALPQIVWTCNAEGMLDWVNDRWLELTGLSREEALVSERSAEAVHPDDRERIQRSFARAVEARSPCEFEYRIRSREGAYRYYFCRAVPVRDAGGAVVRWVAAAFDIHDRRLAEEALRASERRFETIFHRNPQAIAITRLSDGKYLDVNEACLKLMGFTREEVLGSTAMDLGIWTPAEREAIVAPLRVAPWAEVELPFVSKDGRRFMLLITSTRVELEGELCLVNVAIDVTEWRAAEAALREADRRKDEFLALLSHEMRNPLAPILAAAQLMQHRGDVATPRERDVIIRQAQHLVRLVDDLLDVSRVARGKITLTKQTIEIEAVVAKALEVTVELFEHGQHHLYVAVPPRGLRIEGDEVRLTQVVANLLTNAARYTAPGGRIDVSASKVADEVVLRVRDNGRGIEPDLLPGIFDMFVQGPRGPDRAEGGLGLGLSLVRMLITLHGGTVTAASDGPGKGSEFTVHLPASTRPVAQAQPAELPHPPLKRARAPRRVLLVDDNRDAAEMIATLLSAAGHEVRVANDPAEALREADSFCPQVAILDIGLPVMDGYTLGGELRERLGDATPTLIALTGYGQEQDRRRSKEAGFALHLVKPIDTDTLVRMLDSLPGPG
jgi:PAS domain S-box-containing protein